MMKKKFLALTLTAVLGVTMIAGCGSKDNGSTDDGETTDSGAADGELTTDEITLKVWESTEGPDDFIKQAGEAFTEKYPNITIEYENVELADSTGQIQLDGPAGVGADVFAAPHDKLGELTSSGSVLPTVDAETIADQALASTVVALTKDGTMYGYPVSAETYALFYNKDLISEDEIPASFEEMGEFIESYDKSKFAYLMNVGSVYYTSMFSNAEGNYLFGDEGTDTVNSNINSERSVEGMKVFQNLSNYIDASATDLTTDIADAAFASGDVAMYPTGLWNVNVFEDAGVNFGVTTMPSIFKGDDTPAGTFSSARAMFVSAYTDYPAEAAAFAAFLVSEEMQQLRYDLTGALPSIDMEVESEYVQGTIAQLEYASPMPSIPEMTAYWTAADAASANIWNGTEVQSELDALEAAVVGN